MDENTKSKKDLGNQKITSKSKEEILMYVASLLDKGLSRGIYGRLEVITYNECINSLANFLGIKDEK